MLKDTDWSGEAVRSQEIVFSIVVGAGALLSRDNPLLQFPHVLWALVGLLAFNLAYHKVLRKHGEFWAVPFVSVASNTLLITAVLWASGGEQSYLWPMYFLPIFTACLYLKPVHVLVAWAASAAFLANFYIEPLWYDPSWEALELVAKTGILGLAAFVTSHFSSREKQVRGELALSQADLVRAYADLKKMERVREVFGQFATPEVAGLVLSSRESWWKRGERRGVTILFADVRGFTPFAGEVAPERAVEALTEIFDLINSAVRSENGILNKFIGDGVMALFGAPLEVEDHPAAGARAALKALKAVEDWSRARRLQGLVPLRIGIGLNTGEVVAGCLGTKERTEYSVIGHAVNLASRLESAAGEGEILVGPETASLIQDGFELEDRGELLLTGVSGPVRIRALKGVLAAAPSAAELGGTGTA